MTDHTRPVEITRPDGTTQPGLEWVPARRVDGPADRGQPRTVVIVSDDDGGLLEVDIARERVGEVSDRQADLVRSVLEPKLEGGE